MEASSLVEFQEKVLRHYRNQIFRGERVYGRSLQPGIGRLRTKRDKEIEVSVEKNMLRDFKKRSHLFLPGEKPRSELEWMMIAQHYGLPTRLMDWTVNPLVALYFSVENKSENNEDSVVYVYKNRIEQKKQEDIENPYAIKKDIKIYPFLSDRRMMAQSSRFILVANPKSGIDRKNVDSVIIRNRFRRIIKRDLSAMGINSMSIYPDLVGVSSLVKYNFTNSH